MALGLVCAVGTSLCWGVGSVLQSAAAQDATPALRFDPRLLLDLLKGWRYPVGLAMDGVGFLLSLIALRTLPLYVVQSVTSSFLAVTAVAAVLMLGLRMRVREVGALIVVVFGLTLVGLSAAPEEAHAVGMGTQWLVLAAAVVVVVASLPLVRVSGAESAWLLGGLSGIGFGVVAVAARLLSSSINLGHLGHDVRLLVTSPAFYAVLVATPLALVGYATALQRGTVVQATAPLVVGETVLPALAGLALLGDHSRPGWGAVAAVGFVLAVGASLLLSRFGEMEPAVSGS